jgi:hypothetical protein
MVFGPGARRPRARKDKKYFLSGKLGLVNSGELSIVYHFERFLLLLSMNNPLLEIKFSDEMQSMARVAVGVICHTFMNKKESDK